MWQWNITLPVKSVNAMRMTTRPGTPFCSYGTGTVSCHPVNGLGAPSTDITWKCSVWMWKGWTSPLVLVIVHSSTVPSAAGVENTELAMSNCLPLMYICVPVLSSDNVTVRCWAMGALARSGGAVGSDPVGIGTAASGGPATRTCMSGVSGYQSPWGPLV